MRRTAVFHAVAIAGSIWGAFFLHSFIAGPPLRERGRSADLDPPPGVQVGLGRCLRAEVVRIAVRGPYQVQGKAGVLGGGDALEWTEIRSDGGVRFGDRVFPESPVFVIPAQDGTLEIEYVRDHRGNPVPAAGVRYRGKFVIHALPERRVVLVNEVDLEDYLYGVVGKEMSLSEGIEALKTQVVAARTYAVHEQRLERLRRIKGEKFDLYDDERSQVYGGMERETSLARDLVDGSRGMFLTYEGRLVRAFYSSSCGGHTEAAWEVLGDETERIPPLGGRACDYCIRRPAHRWKEPALFTRKEIVEKCVPRDLQNLKLKGVEITKTLPGGHALEVTISFENTSRTVKLHANGGFRRALSTQKLKSTLWDRIEDRGDSIAVYGRGYGHGAGMCQVGAYEMAREGRTASEILEYYFPGARVQKLY